jgi:hypothetical protein
LRFEPANPVSWVECRGNRSDGASTLPYGYQFHVGRGRLSCMLLQRSVDQSLGCPFFSGIAMAH